MIEDVLCFASHALAPLSVLLLHLQDRLLLPCLQHIGVYRFDWGEGAIEPGARARDSLAEPKKLKAGDVCDWDEMEVTKLILRGGRRVRRGGCGIDSDSIGVVGDSEQNAFKLVVFGRSGNSDTVASSY